jgi:ferredoxin
VSPLRVVIDTAICEGHALCVVAAPSVFELGEDDRAIVMDVELTDDVLVLVEDAIVRCPVQAISLQSNAGGAE